MKLLFAICAALAVTTSFALAEDAPQKISDETPAESQNKRLLPFAGKRVTATGKLYTRGGSNALVIEKIAETAGQ